jgi:predicted O-methyltransferase YrrM
MEQENEIMDAYTVIFDQMTHLGPGDSVTTRNMVERLRPHLPSASRVGDFGCGVGSSALVLAQSYPGARVLALDAHAPFIARLESTAGSMGLEQRISAVEGDMAEPPSLEGIAGGFDLVWAESSIYNIGRSKAFTRWRPLLKPGGWLVFSDIVWQCEPAARSEKASAFWAREYTDITTADAVVDELIAAGYDPLDPVVSGRECWSNYYEPLRDRLRLLARKGNCSPALIDVMAEFEREIDVFDCVGDEVALTFFLASRDGVPNAR